MTILSGGNVGIGTTTPLATLESGGGVNKASIRIADGAHDGSSSTFRYPALTYYARQDNTRRAIDPLTQGTGSNGGASAAIVFTDEPGNYSFPNNVRSSSIEFYTADNNLGGSVAYEPLNRLSISSTGTSTFTSNASTAPAIFKIDASEVSRIDSSGRLLVGTSSARSFFSNNDTPAFQVEGTTTTGREASITSSDSGTSGAVLLLAKQRSGTIGGNTIVQSGDQIGYLGFQANDGSKMIPAAVIEGLVDGTPGANSMPGRLVFSTNSGTVNASPTERMRIDKDGWTNVYHTTDGFQSRSSQGAGTTWANFASRHSATATTNGTISFAVWTNGNVQNTNNSYTAISDIKLKENVVDANSQWDDIKALQVRNYNLKEGQTHTQIGLVAQEVEPISPGLVYESPDRDEEGNDLGTVTKSVNYSVLYMKAVKALQEAMERIEALEADVAALKGA
jgi:hypothetical protein